MMRFLFPAACALLAVATSASAQIVTGTVSAREAVDLPPTAIVEVTLEDVSRADAPAVAIATARLEAPGALPVPYALRFATTAIHPGRRYAVRARILDRDRLVFTTTDSYPVLTQGHGSAADVVVRRVGDAAPPPANPPELPRPEPLASTTPMARAVPIAPPPTLADLPASFIGTLPCDGCSGTRAHLNLLPDDSFFLKLADQGRAGIIDDLGSWAASSDGQTIVLQGRERAYVFGLQDATAIRPIDAAGQPVGVAGRHDLRRTARFQPLEVRTELQGAYRRAGSVSLFTECSTGRTWEVSAAGAGAELDRQYREGPMGGDVLLITVEGRVAEAPRGTGPDPLLHVDRVVRVATDATCVPRFAAAPLQRTNWRLVELDRTAVPPGIDARNQAYLVFDDNTNRFSGSGGCNRLVGAYDVNGSGIAMTVAGTMVACPAGERESRFTSALAAAARYRIAGQELALIDDQGAVIARFEADGTR